METESRMKGNGLEMAARYYERSGSGGGVYRGSGCSDTMLEI